jgi:two-component system response regulator
VERVDILLVDDNRYDEKLTLRVLKKHHPSLRSHVAHDGAEALEFIFGTGQYKGRDWTNSPKVVLLDIKLPKIDGLEVLRRIRLDPRTTRQPVVLLTSSAEKRDIDTAYEHHANSYIVKPVDHRQFSDVVREAASYWSLVNQPPGDPDQNYFSRRSHA